MNTYIIYLQNERTIEVDKSNVELRDTYMVIKSGKFDDQKDNFHVIYLPWDAVLYIEEQLGEPTPIRDRKANIKMWKMSREYPIEKD